MELTPDIQHKLIGDVYDAALKPELWEPVMKELAEIWDARVVNLLVGDTLNPAGMLIHSHGGTEEDMALFAAGGFDAMSLPMAEEWIKSGLPIGELGANQIVFGSIEAFGQALGRMYTDYLQKIDLIWQLGAMLELTDFRFAYLGFSRSEKLGPWDKAQTDASQFLMPHLRRALQIHRQMSHVRQENVRLYRMLDRMVAGVLLVNAQGRVCYANPSAEELLSRHDVLGVSARYGLKAAVDTDWTQLKSLLQGAIRTGVRDRHRLSPDTTPAGGVLGLHNHQGEMPLMLTITPLSEMSGYQDLASDGIAAGIFLTNPKARRKLAFPLLQQLFNLNPRECDVCEAFVNTATLEGIADTLGITMSTVRSYMKIIYEKTGHRSQAELMKLLMGLTLDFEHIR